MAVVSPNGRARGSELYGESVVLVGFHFASDETPSARGAMYAPGSARLGPPPDEPPRYDKEARQLWYGGVVLKTMTKSDSNQEIILKAFQDEMWKPRIDDPLPRPREADHAQRLHGAVHDLNEAIVAAAERAMAPRWIVQFHSDGTGEGIRWEAIAFVADAVAPARLEVWPRAVRSRGAARSHGA